MTTSNQKRFNRDGVEVPNEGPLLDGQYMRVPMSMMDHRLHEQIEDKFAPVDAPLVGHRPGFIGINAPVSAADTANFTIGAAAREARIKAMNVAWQKVPKPASPPFAKDAAPILDPAKPAERATATAAEVDAAIAARDSRLENAWKKGAAV
jgi:hypothetical protein